MTDEEGRGEKRSAIGAFILPFLGAALGAAATMAGAYLTFANNDRKLDIEMVNISLAILKGDFEDEEVKEPIHARRFALRALSKYSGIEMSEAEIESWARSGGVPFSKISNFSWTTQPNCLLDYAANRELCDWVRSIDGVIRESSKKIDKLPKTSP